MGGGIGYLIGWLDLWVLDLGRRFFEFGAGFGRF